MIKHPRGSQQLLDKPRPTNLQVLVNRITAQVDLGAGNLVTGLTEELGVGAIREIDMKVSMAGEQGRLQHFARFLALGVASHTEIGLQYGFAGLINDSGISARV